MGVVKKLVGGVFGGAEKPAPPPPPPAPAEPTKSASEKAQEVEDQKKTALIAANAGGTQAATTLGTGDGDVTRKNLLGL